MEMSKSWKQMTLAGLVAGVGLVATQVQGQTIPPACGGKSTVVVNSRITASTTWTANNEYILTNVTFVLSGATLTIEPGTVIRGLRDSNTPGPDNPGALVVTRGAKIIANGTPTQPIVFTDEDDDNVPGCTPTAPYNAYQQLTGQWGGVCVLGRTFIAVNTASGPNPTRDNQLEGLVAEGTLGRYGGNNDDDNSGSLSYISIRYGGYGLAPNSEINGLTMGGVGRATKVSHIEVVNNLDDGIELFGGTVDMKYIALWGIGDDGFDTDEGWRGRAQFIFNVQADAGGTSVGSGIPDRGFESDGGLNPDQSQPYSLNVIYNATSIGKGQTGGGGSYTAQPTNVGAMLRDNAGQQIFNSLFLDFGGPAVALSNEGGDTAINVRQRYVTPFNDFSFHLTGGGTNLPASYYYKVQSEGFQADFRDNVVWQCGVGSGVGVVGTSANWNLIRGDTATHSGSEPPNPFNENWRAGFIGTNWNNVVASSLPIVSLTRAGTAPANRMFNPTFVDPRPSVGSPARTVTRVAPVDGFFTPVGYKGAFQPDGCMWTTGWTLIAALGLVPSDPCPPAPATTDITLYSAISFPTLAGKSYVVLASPDNVNFGPIGVVAGDGTTKTFVDTRGLPTRQFYKVEALQ